METAAAERCCEPIKFSPLPLANARKAYLSLLSHSHSPASLVQRTKLAVTTRFIDRRPLTFSIGAVSPVTQDDRSQSVTHPGRIPSVRGIGGNCFALGGKWASSAVSSPPPSPSVSIQKWRRWNVTLYKLFVTFLLLLSLSSLLLRAAACQLGMRRLAHQRRRRNEERRRRKDAGYPNDF